MKRVSKRVPVERPPEEVHGSADAGIAPTWPDHNYEENSSSLNDVTDEGNAGKKSGEPGGDF